MAHPLLVKAADVASDGGSDVLILRGVTGRLLSKSRQPSKVPLASKTSTDPGVLFRRSGFAPDDAAFDESVPTNQAATDPEERSAPKAGGELAPILPEEAPAENRLA
jgi:hypothetical protein